MVIRIQCNRDHIMATGERADMEPVTIDARKLCAIDIDMSMTLTLVVLKAGGRPVIGEVFCTKIEIPATNRVFLDGSVHGWLCWPVVDSKHPMLMRTCFMSGHTAIHVRVVFHFHAGGHGRLFGHVR